MTGRLAERAGPSPTTGAGDPVVARAPGKLILMGEHAAVYGQPAVVTAVGLEVTVEVRPAARGAGGGDLVELDLVTLGHRERIGWRELGSQAATARVAWERYCEDPTPARFAELRSSDPARVVKLALGEVARELAAGRTEPPSAARVRVTSELPVGSGLGSSAAVALATVAAALAFGGEAVERERLDRLALEVERRQHGLPSGVDQATVLRGGVVLARRGERGLEVEPLDADPTLLSRFAIYDTGEPAESTGEVVAAVSARRAREGAGFDRRLERMGAASERFARALARREAESEIVRELRGYQRELEELGVVPASVAAAVRRVEAAGAAAKISGAGALSEPGAGSLVVYRPEGRLKAPSRRRGEARSRPRPATAGDRAAALAGYRPLAAALGAPGLTVEVLV